MNKNIDGKRILVTGGTGSFGKMLVSKLMKLNPKEVIVFSRDEDKQGLMRFDYPKEERIRFVLGDIRDYHSVRQVMRGVDIVFHAAALKWITEVECNVWEGVKTNVIGAQNIIEAAKDENIEKVVALSTDKAVEPVNAYGMAKALQERLITTANLYNDGTRTVFVSTRYGNVLGSRGSVVPHFKSLLKDGKKLTITDEKMTRFILTLDESVDLVLKALEMGVGGEVFVRKMPGHKITDLANVLLSANGQSEGDYTVTGIRPGEKIHETLISPSESVRTVEDGEYYVILPQVDIKAVNEKYSKHKFLPEFRYSSELTEQIGKDELKLILSKEGFI